MAFQSQVLIAVPEQRYPPDLSEDEPLTWKFAQASDGLVHKNLTLTLREY